MLCCFTWLRYPLSSDRHAGEPPLNGKNILKFSLLALVFLGLVVAWLGFGERGFIHLYRMDRERQTYFEKINKLERENRELLDEIQRLRSDRDYVENLGRRELGLVKEDELMYRFETKKEKEKPKQ
jgi:cell division protein FtsB